MNVGTVWFESPSRVSLTLTSLLGLLVIYDHNLISRDGLVRSSLPRGSLSNLAVSSGLCAVIYDDHTQNTFDSVNSLGREICWHLSLSLPRGSLTDILSPGLSTDENDILRPLVCQNVSVLYRRESQS